MVTRVNKYSAIDQFGDVAQRTVGIEVNNSSIPRYRMNATIGYGIEDLQFSWTVRYISAVKEACGNAAVTGPGVGGPARAPLPRSWRRSPTRSRR